MLLAPGTPPSSLASKSPHKQPPLAPHTISPPPGCTPLPRPPRVVRSPRHSPRLSFASPRQSCSDGQAGQLCGATARLKQAASSE
eukprot:351269-Chlamydomonas_euryale.AAC.3